MQDKPTIETLINAVSLFIKDVASPALSGRSLFHARVAQNVLAIVEREALYGAQFSSAQQDRLRLLLDMDGDLEALNKELCARIKDGRLSAEDVRAHLVKSTMGKLSIDQPNYAGYLRARELGWPEEDGYQQ
ncbi:DUF6285 domain-containing protein [Alphaproteobacteria bacterium]|jgi:hypothetical protein|nr:DUF6285 domain-containing protein [Alphaproteobacteria bacterium]